MSKRGIVIVISGPSGSGKGTVVKELRGICPDMVCETSAEDFQRGYDHVLHEGLTVIAQIAL